MKPKQLIPVLSVAIQNSFNVLLKGRPGCGKSDIISQVVNKLGYDMMICHPVVDDPTDYKGLPCTIDGKAVFLPYGNLEMMMKATKPLTVVFDDLGQAALSVQAACMQLLLAREINGKKISKHVRFVAATNSRKDNAGVQGLITPLLSRFKLITELDVSVEDWQTWAIANNIPMELIAFAGFRPPLFMNQRLERVTTNGKVEEKFVDIPVTKDIENFACLRTIAALGDWINAGIIDPEVWKGVVGESFATEFYSFHRTYKELAGLPEAIILNPDKARLPDITKPDIRFALTHALVAKATEVNFENIVTYMCRMQKEMQVFFMKSATALNPELQATDGFINWSVKNKEFTK